MTDWQNGTAVDKLEAAGSSGFNFGILTGRPVNGWAYVAIDVDARTERDINLIDGPSDAEYLQVAREACKAVRAAVEDVTGFSEWWRHTREGRIALLVKVQAATPTVGHQSIYFSKGGSTFGEVELLGSGNQLAALGTYAKTLMAIEWRCEGEEPVAILDTSQVAEFESVEQVKKIVETALRDAGFTVTAKDPNQRKRVTVERQPGAQQAHTPKGLRSEAADALMRKVCLEGASAEEAMEALETSPDYGVRDWYVEKGGWESREVQRIWQRGRANRIAREVVEANRAEQITDADLYAKVCAAWCADADGFRWFNDRGNPGGSDDSEARKVFNGILLGFETLAAEEEFAPLEPANSNQPAGVIAPDETAWRQYIKRDERNAILKNEFNAVAILKHAPIFRDRLRFNEFALTAEFDGRELTDDDITMIACIAQQNYANISGALFDKAATLVAKLNPYHPIRTWLQAQVWDCVPRIDTWLIEHASAEDSAFNRAVGRKWLISAVARVMDPGCKVDTVLVLEGPQGMLKSTLLEHLCPDRTWFRSGMPPLSDHDAMSGLRGNWIIELAELSAMRRADLDSVKAYLANRVDKYRPKYGRRDITVPRQNVFAATVNDDSYLKDASGARRFWPVACAVGKPVGWEIDIASFDGVVPQIWAEAVAAYAAGEAWWLEGAEAKAMQRDAAEDRFDTDEWHNHVVEWLHERGSPSEITIGGVLSSCLGISADRQGRAEQNRVSAVLKRLGYSRKKIRRGKATPWAWVVEHEEPISTPATSLSDLLTD
ncbi:virulence-associated E family protein [Acidisoma sp. C75]